MSIKNGYHTTRVRVRYAETDQMGVAYNAHYLTWFEVGRTEFMREIGVTYHETEKDGYFLPVSGAGIQFLKPALYDDVLTVRTHISEKPGARLKLSYEILRGGEVISTGFTEHVFTDRGMAPKRPPKGLRNQLMALWQAADEMKEKDTP